jgi:hypothetical protein
MCHIITFMKENVTNPFTQWGKNNENLSKYAHIPIVDTLYNNHIDTLF